MARRSRTFLIPTLGINSAVPGTLIDPRSTPRCKNIQVWRSLLEKRRGGIAFGDSLAERVLMLASFDQEGVQYILRAGPTKVEQWTGSAWESIANAALTAAATDTMSWCFPVLGGLKVIVFTNFKDNIRSFDGGMADQDLDASAPKAKFVVYYKGYIVALSTEESGDAFPSRVRWPDAGTADYATGDAGAKDLLEDDQEITGGSLFGDYIAVHKESGIYLGYLTNTSTIFRFDRREAPGTVANNTIVNLPNGEQAYLSREGIRVFNGVNAPLVVSPINEELRETMSAKQLYRSWGLMISSLDEAWFGIAIGDHEDPDTVFKYNYLTRQMYKDERPDATMAALFKKTDQASWDSDPEPWDSDTTRWDSLTSLALHKRALIGFSSGETHERTDSANDDGEAVDSEWESKDYTAADFPELGFGPEEIALEWQGVEIVARGTSVDVYYSLDEGENFNFAGTLTLGSSWPTDADPLIKYFRAFGSKCRIKLKNNAVGGSFQFKQLRPILVPREGRQ